VGFPSFLLGVAGSAEVVKCAGRKVDRNFFITFYFYFYKSTVGR